MVFFELCGWIKSDMTVNAYGLHYHELRHKARKDHKERIKSSRPTLMEAALELPRRSTHMLCIFVLLQRNTLRI